MGVDERDIRDGIINLRECIIACYLAIAFWSPAILLPSAALRGLGLYKTQSTACPFMRFIHTYKRHDDDTLRNGNGPPSETVDLAKQNNHVPREICKRERNMYE